MKWYRHASDLAVSEDIKSVRKWSDEEMDYVENDVRVLRMSDSEGGTARIIFYSGDEDAPTITSWNSVPVDLRNMREEGQYKRRGFATKVILKLKEMGISEFYVTVQSADARKALSRLSEKGIIQPIPGFQAGVSVDLHPTKFRIN
jgi:hypothetical protein